MTPIPRRPSVIAARTAVLFAALAVAALSHAASDAAFQSAFDHFAKASAGQSDEVEPATTAFEALAKAEPGNAVLLAYAGAGTAMKSTTTIIPMRKLAFAEDGLAMIDKALAMLTPASDAPLQRGTPATLEVKYVAANTFLAVPGFMNRGARGARLLNEVVTSPLLAQAPVGFAGGVLMRAAALAEKDKRTDDTRRFWREVVERKAPQAEAAQAKLRELAP